MSGWMCQCGHNRSMHREEWNKFRAARDTGCTVIDLSHPSQPRCRCAEFVSQQDAGPELSEVTDEEEAACG